MATYTQYDADANGAGAQLAEDVENTMWHDISPELTPVMTLSQQHTSNQKLTEWLEIEKRAPIANAQVEGVATVGTAGHTPARLNNNQQILEELAQVSSSLEAADEYGISSQMAEEIALKTIELRTDCEFAAVGAPGGTRQTGATGDSSTAREMKALQEQISAATTVIAGGGTPPLVLLEADVLECHQKIRVKGGGKDLFMVHSISAALDVAQFISSSAGDGDGRRRDFGESMKLVNAVEIYVTPWGTLTSVVDDFIDPETCILMDPEYVAMKYLQPFQTKPLSEDGFHSKRGLLVEVTVAALNTFASGFIDDILNT